MKPSTYEELARKVCEELSEVKGVKVFRGKIFVGKRSKRRIKTDVSFLTKVLGSKVLVIVECKKYNHKVSVDDVEEFHSKLDDIGAHKGIMATTTGFQNGAVKTARGRGIALAVLSPNPKANELEYIVKYMTVEDLQRSLNPPILQGNLISWGHLDRTVRKQGIRFNSANEFHRNIQLSMFDQFGKK